MAESPAKSGIRALLKSVTTDAKQLVQDQAELTKREVRASSQQAGSTGGLFAGAAFIGILAVVFLLIALAYVLVAVGLPEWAGFGIVALALILVAAVLGAAGRAKAKKMSNGLELSKKELERTQQVLAGSADSETPALGKGPVGHSGK